METFLIHGELLPNKTIAEKNVLRRPKALKCLMRTSNEKNLVFMRFYDVFESIIHLKLYHLKFTCHGFTCCGLTILTFNCSISMKIMTVGDATREPHLYTRYWKALTGRQIHGFKSSMLITEINVFSDKRLTIHNTQDKRVHKKLEFLAPQVSKLREIQFIEKNWAR